MSLFLQDDEVMFFLVHMVNEQDWGAKGLFFRCVSCIYD